MDSRKYYGPQYIEQPMYQNLRCYHYCQMNIHSFGWINVNTFITPLKIAFCTVGANHVPPLSVPFSSFVPTFLSSSSGALARVPLVPFVPLVPRGLSWYRLLWVSVSFCANRPLPHPPRPPDLGLLIPCSHGHGTCSERTWPLVR